MPGTIRSIGWSLYAASSWTWCIGLFLPAILMQWFGWAGFVMIAVPNCIGAAAMGLLLGSPSASRRFCRRHPTAISSFVSVTIAFHLIFLAIVARWLSPPEFRYGEGWILWPLASLALAWVVSMLPTRHWPWLGLLGLLGGALIVAINAGAWTGAWSGPGWSGPRAPIDLLWLSPVFVIGFLLCPWLDAPFHRARQETTGPLAFLLLAPLFLCMLLVTASYWWLTEATATLAVLLWLFGQSTFTIAANLRECRRGGVAHYNESGWFGGCLIVAGIGIAAVVNSTWAGTANLYLGLLAVYGIGFSTIILAWCRRRSPAASTPRVIRLTVLLLLAGWLGNVGFIDGPAWVAVLPAVLVLIAPAVVGSAGSISKRVHH